jgi:tetratricopeptide (TPR) repeat protein
MMLVSIEMTAGNHTRAFELADAARSHLDDLEDNSDDARILASFATFEAMAGRLDAARADSERAVRLARQTGNQQVLANVLNGRAWALQRDDPEAALAVAEEFLELYRRTGVARSVAPGLTALAAGLRARLGDDHGALPLLRDAAIIARDDGTLPPAAAALGFALNPLCRTGRPDVAATLIGALDRGALAHVAGFPGTADARARILARVRDALGDDRAERLLERGAAMTFDEVIGYAIEELGAAQP